MLDLKISADRIATAEKLLAHIPGGINKAVYWTLNRVSDGVKTDLVNEGKTRYYIKPGEIRKSFEVKKASSNDLELILKSRGKRKNLSEYFISPKSPKKGMQGIQAAVKRDGVKYIGGAFFIKRGGKYRAYLRVGKGRWDIESITSPAIPQILKNPEIVKIVEEKAGERFSKRIEHETSRILQNFMGFK